MARSSEAEEVDVDGTPVRFTSGDRVVFPELGEAGGTKRHLLEHYLAVLGVGRAGSVGAEGPGGATTPERAAADGPFLAAVRDRPTYLQRFPTGLAGDEVYAKRVPARAPGFVADCEVVFPSGRTARALRPDGAAALVWAVQMSTITFHTWPARCASEGAGAVGAVVGPPDELRIDLDPQPGTGFDDARRVALDVLAPLLDELGLSSRVKTSGGRGLHVHVPIAPRHDATTVRRAGIALARELERRAAGRVTTAWWKEQRGQQVFVDYNQNATDHTMAAPYAVRATPRATVSTPVTWAELVDVDPADATMATVPGLLAHRGDPWAALGDTAHDLSGLLEAADRDEAAGLGDLPYPPTHPKVAGEPKRVQPSRDRDRR